MILGLQRRLARGDGFGMRDRGRRLGRATIEIGDSDFDLGWLGRDQFIGDRPGQPVLAITATATASAAPAATAARTPLSAALVVATGKARLLLGLVLVGFAFVRLS